MKKLLKITVSLILFLLIVSSATYFFMPKDKLSDKQYSALMLYHLGLLLQNGDEQLKIAANLERAVEYYQQASEQGLPMAMSQLGYLYQMGIGVAQSDQQAVEWYQTAAEKGDPQGMNYLGLCYQQGIGVEANSNTAISWFEKAIDLDYAPAIFNLANLYQHEESENYINKNRAFGLYILAAKKGSLEAQKYLVDQHCAGQVPGVMIKASWLEREADRGLACAKYTLGLWYDAGFQVEHADVEKAAALYQQAMALGNHKAQYQLGLLMLDGRGIKQDIPQGITLLEGVVGVMDSRVEFKLGQIYHYDTYQQQDYSKAIYWYNQAAQRGNSEAQSCLATLYLAGLGTEKDANKAHSLWLQAAEADNYSAQFQLAQAYYSGEHWPQDYEQAKYWLDKAHQGKDKLIKSQAYELIGRLYEEGKGVEKSYNEAILYYRNADYNDDDRGSAAYRLGLLYEKGEHGNANTELAIKWYGIAIKKGHNEAKLALQKIAATLE